VDILCALALANGELVSKDELMQRLWPGRAVEEGNLYVHMSALRAALGERPGGAVGSKPCPAGVTGSSDRRPP